MNIAEVVLVLAAGTLFGYLLARRPPRWGIRIPSIPPGSWPWWARLSTVLAVFLATAPVWPVVQPGDPIADELLEPAEVAALVPLVLVFPVAWALLGRWRPYATRVAVALTALTAAWALWTVTAGTYASPPTIDDGLRWYLGTAGVLVAAATAYEGWRRPLRPGRRWVAGALMWTVGLAAVVATPVVGDAQLPPRDTILPLPEGMTVIHEEAGCRPTCVRRFTVASADGLTGQDLARRLGVHLEQAKGWPTRWYDFAPPQFGCRRVGWLNPYEHCVELRPAASGSAVDLWLTTYNGRDQVVY